EIPNGVFLRGHAGRVRVSARTSPNLSLASSDRGNDSETPLRRRAISIRKGTEGEKSEGLVEDVFGGVLPWGRADFRALRSRAREPARNALGSHWPWASLRVPSSSRRRARR